SIRHQPRNCAGAAEREVRNMREVILCDSEGEWNALHDRINAALGYPDGHGTERYADLPEPDADGKYHLYFEAVGSRALGNRMVNPKDVQGLLTAQEKARVVSPPVEIPDERKGGERG